MKESLTHPSIEGLTEQSGNMMTQPGLSKNLLMNDISALQSGIASRYWIELIPIPASAPRLWLFVNNSWKRLNNPSSNNINTVQRAFLGADSNVRVWFDGSLVSGLVVEGS